MFFARHEGTKGRGGSAWCQRSLSLCSLTTHADEPWLSPV